MLYVRIPCVFATAESSFSSPPRAVFSIGMGLSRRGDGRNLRFESHRDLRSRAVPRGTPTAPDHEETAGLRQRKLCKEKPNLRVPSGTAHRPGWRWLARLFESQFLYLLLYPQRKFGLTPFSEHCRLVEADGRRHPRRKAGAARHTKAGFFLTRHRWRRPKNCSATTLLQPTSIDHAPWRFILFRQVRNS